MFNNPYMPNAYNPQATLDRINNQMNELDKIRQQVQQQTMQPQTPTNLTQNFQIAPTNREVIKYATSIDEVQRDMVIGDTPYFSKDMSVVWIKNTKGDIKTYELTEIVPKDEKDLQIEYLQSQIEELKGKIDNEQFNSNVDTKQNATDTTTDDGAIGTTVKKSKSTNVSKVSGSKEE
jgi:hypothetical protein